jgi:hypothetical protein
MDERRRVQPTIAVVYPGDNQALFGGVKGTGALVSKYYLGELPRRGERSGRLGRAGAARHPGAKGLELATRRRGRAYYGTSRSYRSPDTLVLTSARFGQEFAFGPYAPLAASRP